MIAADNGAMISEHTKWVVGSKNLLIQKAEFICGSDTRTNACW